MRSRFAAFALGLAPYLRATWAESTRPKRLHLDARLTWRGLQIVDAVAGGETDATGIVEFRAAYRAPDGFGVLHERSRFIRESGRWVYLNGDLLD